MRILEGEEMRRRVIDGGSGGGKKEGGVVVRILEGEVVRVRRKERKDGG